MPSATDLLRQIRESSLDPASCYRVRDFQIAREDVKVYLSDGYLIFTKPVAGRRLNAIFTTEQNSGDAEILLLPPTRSERQSLSHFTNSPNLNEHLQSVLFVFTDGMAEELIARLEDEKAAKSPEMAALLAPRWTPVVRNVLPGFEVRIVEDLLGVRKAGEGLFFLTAVGKNLGTFDVIHDPAAREQIVVGQLTERDGRPAYDFWTAFSSRSVRQGKSRPLAPSYTIDRFRIAAALDAGLKIKATTTAHARIGPAPIRALPMVLSRRMRVLGVKIDGQPAQLVERESLRSTALRATDDDSFLVVAAEDLKPGSEHEIEVEHEGAVITSAGNRVYYVASRGSWYPRRGVEYSAYDVTFRFPRGLSLVVPGIVMEDRVEGDVRVMRRKVDTPIRFAGFNLGEYNQATATRGGLTVDVYSNRQVELALQQRPREVVAIAPLGSPRTLGRPTELVTAPPPSPAPIDPKARLKMLATDIASAYEFMSTQFGPPPMTTLTVSPIPGTFGQGFPGLLYLSTMAYLDPADRPAAMRSKQKEVFFSDMIEAHETAHQWFGNVVSPAGYQDDWLMESLSNYAALLYLEKKKGVKIVDTMFDEYRAHLLASGANGKTVESAGPITFGVRLGSADLAESWRVITYEKGSWIMHMLRRRMGEERFAKMVAELCKRYRFQSIDTEQFRTLAAEFLPPPASPRVKVSDPKLENFFENWVYGTGIPHVQVKHVLKGKPGALQVAITLTQTGVDEDFTADIPVEIYYPPTARGGKPAQIVWLRAGSDPATHLIPVRQAPTKIVVSTSSALVKK